MEPVSATYQRWRIERDYRELKQDFGLGHYEGRGWRGFHHYACLSIAAYGFLMAERLIADKPVGGKKNFLERQVPAVPEDYLPRGSPSRAAPCGQLDHDAALSPELRTDAKTRAMPLLRERWSKATVCDTVRFAEAAWRARHVECMPFEVDRRASKAFAVARSASSSADELDNGKTARCQYPARTEPILGFDG